MPRRLRLVRCACLLLCAGGVTTLTLATLLQLPIQHTPPSKVNVFNDDDTAMNTAIGAVELRNRDVRREGVVEGGVGAQREGRCFTSAQPEKSALYVPDLICHWRSSVGDDVSDSHGREGRPESYAADEGVTTGGAPGNEKKPTHWIQRERLARELGQCCCYRVTSWPAVAAASARRAQNYEQVARAARLAGRAESQCLPVLLVVGAQKSGTTALMGYMLFHPGFAAPQRKEAHFFDRGFDTAATLGNMMNLVVGTMTMVGPPIQTTPKLDVLQRYMTSFAQPASRGIAGDATPSYMLSRASMVRARALLPAARIVILLRDPVDRAWSEYNMKLRRVRTQMRLEDEATRSIALEVMRNCRRASL